MELPRISQNGALAMSKLNSLVLSGGGARAAYQVGVLRAISKVLSDEKIGPHPPFNNFVGSSSGALNIAKLLSEFNGNNFAQAVESLNDIWTNIKTEDIYLSDWNSMARNGLKWLKSITLAGGDETGLPLSLLNPAPLYYLMKKNFKPHNIDELLKNEIVHSWAINCFCHNTGKTLTFFDSSPNHDIKTWARFKREAIKGKITLKHIMASSAIPVLFPPVNVFGQYLADGNVRDHAPFSVPIHLGSSSILMICIKESMEEEYNRDKPPTTGKIISSLINTIMSDSIDIDRERIERINQFALASKKFELESESRHINFSIIRPSTPIAKIALKHHHELPNPVKYFLKGIGPKEETAELLSYILFEKPYINELIELGHKDGLQAKESIMNLLSL